MVDSMVDNTDDWARVAVSVVDGHRFVMVEVLVQRTYWQVVLSVANAVGDEADDDVIDSVVQLVDNWHDFLVDHWFSRNYWNDVESNVSMNVVSMIDVEIDLNVYEKMRRMKMIENGNGNESECENVNASVNEILNEYENVIVNGNEYENENEITND